MNSAFILTYYVLCTLSYVSAHGFVGQVAIDGKWYAGNVPNNYLGPSPIRLVDDIGPVKGASNPDLACGLSAQKAAMVVSANPGSTVSFDWFGGGGDNWPHNTGPLMAYMASCGDTTADQFNASGAKWFKIDQLGKNSDDTWYQADLQNADTFTFNLPQDIAPGDYLIRHEIIALHLAVTMGGAEFYPSCTQIRIGGTGTGTPDSTVSFPGAYSDDDPGIYDPDVFDPGANYTFPGPAISNLAATNAGITNPASTTASITPGTGTSTVGAGAGTRTDVATSTQTSTQTSVIPTATATSTAAGGTGAGSSSSLTGSTPKAVCSLRTQSSTMNTQAHLSRVLRRILHIS